MEKSSATDTAVDVDRKSSDDDGMESVQTVADTTSSTTVVNVSSRLVDKENVPPSVVTPNHPRSDDIESSTDKTRAVKRPSCDAVDDDVTPCKTTRDDVSVERAPAMDVVDDDDDVSSSDEVFQQTYTSMSVTASFSCHPAVPSSATRRSSCVPCLDIRLIQNVTEPAMVRPLLVVQVV